MSKHRIRDHYERRFLPHRKNFEILDWASAASQRARFAVLTGNVDLSGKSLLDVGSGLGDLWAFLKEHRVQARYTGVDILEKMVAAARRLHPEAAFVHADVFREDPFDGGRFDVTFCSGTFNLNLGNNHDFLPGAIRRLLELTRRTLVFNLLHERARGGGDLYAYYNPARVLSVLKGLPCDARLIDDYLPNDFTVICTLRPDQRPTPNDQ